MKINKIPGLGRFGVFIDDLDLNNITDEEWVEVGKIHLESLVTIIRCNKLDHLTYYNLMMKWGDNRWTRPLQLYKKYGKPIKELFSKRLLDANDLKDMLDYKRGDVDKKCPGMVRVTGKKNEKGQLLGVFGDGGLGWHSDGSADLAFTPGISLMGVESMIGSSTGFCTTVDWYEKQTESFRSELDEMVLINNFRTTHADFDDQNRLHIKYILEDDEVQKNVYHNNQCPIDDSEFPLVIQSPGGIKGLHYTVDTFDKIKGMSKSDSNKLLTKISKEIFTEEYIYEHKYQSNTDIMLFDNSITLHNREIKDSLISHNRMAYRIQFDYDKLTGEQYRPFFQKKFQELRNENMKDLNIAMS
jgi:alpha-ketoglutarate-dependent taurine dioxygenase